MSNQSRSDNRLTEFISTLKEWLWETDRDGRYTYSSPQVEALLGYSNREILQLTPLDLLQPHETEAGSQKLSESLASQQPFDGLRQYNLHKNGKPVLLEISGRPYYDAVGKFAGFRGSYQSVTEQDEDKEAASFRISLFDSVDHPTMITNADGEITYSNHAFTELFGYAFSEIDGKNVSILFPQQNTSDTEPQHLPPELDEKEHVSAISARKKKDGSTVTVLINARSLIDPQSEISQFVTSYQDLTEIEKHKSTLTGLERDQNLLRQTQSLGQIGGWELDIPTNSLYWTDETYRIHDTTPEEFNPSTDAALSHYVPASREILTAAMEAAITEGKGYDLTLEMYTSKGRKIHVRTLCEVRLKDGRPAKLIGLLQDITAFTARERSLIFSLKESELALASANLGLWILDEKKKTLEWNDSQLEIYEMSREEFNRDPNPKTYQDMTHEDDMEMLLNCLASARKGETIENKTFRIIRRSGEVRTIQGSAAPIMDNKGKMTKLIGINRDITEVKHDKDKIENLLVELSSSLHGTINLAMNLAGMRDPYTAGHQYRVGILSREIGKLMGMSAHETEGLLEMGNLHDIGKFRVPLDILSKPGKLNSAEFNIVKLHARDGYEVLKAIKFPWPVAEAALQHHERVDGNGYPQGLRGDEIILEARVLAVADVVEAMSSHRPYRAQLGIEKALEEIELGRGIKYDAQVVDACLKLFRELRFEIPSVD